MSVYLTEEVFLTLKEWRSFININITSNTHEIRLTRCGLTDEYLSSLIQFLIDLHIRLEILDISSNSFTSAVAPDLKLLLENNHKVRICTHIITIVFKRIKLK
jgi:Ran GTPase-activating protein (RanGAP) involved in mRNA processing and transport